MSNKNSVLGLCLAQRLFLNTFELCTFEIKGTQYYSITLNVGTTILIAIYTFVVDKESQNVDSNNNNEQQEVEISQQQRTTRCGNKSTTTNNKMWK